MIKLTATKRYCPITRNTYEWRRVGQWDIWGYTLTMQLVRIK